MEKGFLYVANQQKFIDEAIISVKSLRRFNPEPVGLICTPELQTDSLREVFDRIIPVEELRNQFYLAKVIGLQHSPFEKTVFLDGDTFITDSVSELFELLNLVDFATTAEQKGHTSGMKNLAYQHVFPEFNTGVIAFRNTEIMQKIFRDWLRYCRNNSLKNDMPGMREAVIENFRQVHFSILPSCYNEHGFKTMLVLYKKVKIIHERLDFKRGIYTPFFSSFESMDKFAKKINKITYKRIYIPKIGVIPYQYSPQNVLTKIKKKLGYKEVSKNI